MSKVISIAIRMGLGVFVQGAGPAARFGHPGDNTGFTSSWVSLMQGGHGCILMTNSDNGWPLQKELLRTIAQVYAWPELPPRENHESLAAEGAAASDIYVGDQKQTDALCAYFSPSKKLSAT
jgi:hypothetical protein